MCIWRVSNFQPPFHPPGVRKSWNNFVKFPLSIFIEFGKKISRTLPPPPSPRTLFITRDLSDPTHIVMLSPLELFFQHLLKIEQFVKKPTIT